MPKNILLHFFMLAMLLALNVNIYSQQCEVITGNIDFESANSLTFDVFVKNTGASSFTYSHGSFVWTYDTSILNGGTPTFSLVPGYSDFSAGAFPPSALITSPNILRTSSNMPGANGVISAGESLRLYRFRLQTSASSFASDYFNISWKNDATPSTKILSWDSGTGLPVEITNKSFSIHALILTEDFEYTAGDLLTAHGWVAHSGAGTQAITVNDGGLTYTGYVGSGIGNAALVDNNGEDVNKIFPAQTSGTVYTAFMARVDNYVTSSPSYFFHLGQDDPMNSSVYRGKIFAQMSGTTDLQFGLSFASNTPTLTAIDYSIGTTYLVVLKYEIVEGATNDAVSIFIFSGSVPTSEPTTPTIGPLTETVSDLANADAVALRQFNASQNVIVDGIRIATSWSDIFPSGGNATINVSPSSLSGFTYLVGGGPSPSQSYNLSGSNLSPVSGNLVVTGSTNYEVSLNNSTFSGSVNVPYSGGTLAATPIWVRLKAGLAGGLYDGEVIANAGGTATTQNVTCNGAVIKPEPTNHVTNFTGVLGNPAYYYNNLSWIDATGGTIPDGYLIRKSFVSFDDIIDPVDGTSYSNSLSDQNVLAGTQTATFTGFAGSTYYYKIFPYSNTGTYIDYKITAPVPQFSITNASAPTLPVTENFEYPNGSDLANNGWVVHSGVNFPILVNATSLTYSGYINSGLGKSVSLTPPGTTSAQDDNRAFDSVYSGSIYASFMVNVDSATATSVYFFHFGPENSTSIFRGKVFVQKDVSGNLAFGVSKSSNTALYTPYNYSLNTTYLIVVKYTFNTGSGTDDEVKLWVNPVLNGIEPTSDLTQTDTGTDPTSIGFFALRQATDGPGITIGGLRVATTWVPEAGSTTFQLSVNIANGWNMVSIPGLHPTDQNVNTWWAFRDMGANVFRYAGGYQSVTAAVPGTGYWMKHAGARTYNTGDEWPAGGINIVAHSPLTAASGWNLIGGYEIVATAALVTTNPPGLQQGSIYKYSGGYQVATTIDPGYGYWIKLSGAGQIIIPETFAKGGEPVEMFPENWGKIVMTDATGINYTLYAVKGEVNLDNYELPPAPPAGMFDIRFSSGRIAEDINSSIKTIDMSGVTYPLTVRVEGMDIRLMDESGKMINTNLKSGEDVVISDATIQKLMVSGELIPAEYALEQNYPNPFNPSTVIEFSLPENVGNVKLSIYNMLGEKVAELVNSALTAGKYQYQWNAQNVATGMYIYEIRTDNFVAIKKMLLIK